MQSILLYSCCLLLVGCSRGQSLSEGEQVEAMSLHGVALSQESVGEILKMSQMEKSYLINTLGQISQQSSKEAVKVLLGKPSRDISLEGIGTKLNWWICIEKSAARVGVWFDPEGNAIEVALEAIGKYYYRQHITASRLDHQESMLRLNWASLGTQSETVPTCS